MFDPITHLQKNMSFTKQTRKTPAASLKRRKQGLGIPTNMKTPSNGYDIDYHTLLVSKTILYINYIVLDTNRV